MGQSLSVACVLGGRVSRILSDCPFPLMAPTLPDALAGTIIRNDIAPRFRKGDFYGGILSGLRGIAAATRGEYKAAPL